MKLLRAFLLLSIFAASLLAGASPTLAAGSTEAVSLDSSGAQATGGRSYANAISPDGRYVAFSSAAVNLVGGDTNGRGDIFLRDTLMGTTVRVSVDSAGMQANHDSYATDVSSGGQYVSFMSDAGNLVPGDTNGKSDIFVRDLQSGTTTRVSVDSAGNQGNGGVGTHSMSADGRYIAFQSQATNLTPGDTNADWDVFVHDRLTVTTTRVSVSSAGSPGNGGSTAPGISGDGRYVVFSSYASNLVPGDTNGLYDEFIHDRLTGTTALVSVGVGGMAANGATFWGSTNSDGRYVAFASSASNLVAGDSNGQMDVFVRDMQTGIISRISGSGAQGNGASSNAALNADGRYVTFASAASDLAPGDANGFYDVFWHDRQTGTTVLVSVNSSGVGGNAASAVSSISGDGNRIAFDSFACNLTASDTNGVGDVFVHDLAVPGGGPSPNADSDCDGVADNVDNCVNNANADQRDWDGDGVGDPCDPDTNSGIIDNVSVDMNDDATPANLPLGVGTVETCGVILNDDILNADEDSVDAVTVDIVAGPLGVPPGNGLIAFDFRLTYDATDIRVTAADTQQMLAAIGGSDIFDVSDAMPDMDGDLYVGALDLALNTDEDGDGVLARLTLEGTGQGISRLTLANPIGIDPLNNVMLPANLNHASIVVGPVSEPNPCADADGDGVVDAIDNCPATANEDQADNESDGLGDVCDPDDDNAGVYDADEIACGADPLIAVIRPERTDVVFTGVDDDGDGLTDEPTPDGAEAFDCDGDGYKGVAEAGTPLCDGLNNDDRLYPAYPGPQVADDAVVDDGCPGGPAVAGTFSEGEFQIGTTDQDPCGTSAWPSDIVSGGIPDSTNKVNVFEVTSFIVPRRLDTSPGHPDYGKRWDLQPGRGVFNNWINASDITTLISGATGYPPMLAGAKAFNGASCPW